MENEDASLIALDPTPHHVSRLGDLLRPALEAVPDSVPAAGRGSLRVDRLQTLRLTPGEGRSTIERSYHFPAMEL